MDPAEVVAEATEDASSGAELRSRPSDRSLIRIELNNVDGLGRARHVDAHATRELGTVDHGMNGIADGASAHAARGVVGGFAPGAGDLPAAIGELGACIELIVSSGAAHGLRDACARHIGDLAAYPLGGD